MKESTSDLPRLPLRLHWMQVIGVRDPDEGSWGQLRSLQYAQLHRITLGRIVAHALAAIITAAIYLPTVPEALLSGWLGLLVIALWNTARIDRGLADVGRRGMTRAEFRRHAIGVLGCALVWSFALFVFVPYGNSGAHFALWTLVAMLIAGSAATLSLSPIATIVFTLVAGGSAVISFLLGGHYSFATVTCAFIAVATAGTIDAARTYLSARIAEAGVAEKTEVVSLLLREHEENGADWLWQVDSNRRIRGASSRFAAAMESAAQKLEGQSFVRLISGSAWETGNFHPSLHELAERLKQRESFSSLAVRVEIAGERRWWELSGAPLQDSNGVFCGFRGVGSDVTDQREADEKIAYMARYDTLTGLPNRLMLTEALADAMRYGEEWRTRCAFLMIDLDRFKAVNDSLGHQIGDRLLAQVSERLKSVLAEDEHCGRLGGDEFAIVIRDASEKGRVEAVAQKVIDALSEPYHVDRYQLFIGASVGSALGPRDGDSVETLMRNADLALYRAKDEGGGEHCAYEPSLHANAEERRRLELALRKAVGNNELKLNFQPVVDANSEELVSFEALLRWHSKEHGFVSPGKFIPLAEDTRLIVPIGQWVLYEACRQAASWSADVKVAVNVSGEQLLEPGFANTVVRALADTGLPARRLEVEVTESIFLRDARTARQTLEEIMALGCTIALDDFGTGYSSLGYLRELRFSTIKVDRSFVQGAAQGSRESLAIIRAVVAMAQSLEMTTTAEGVETPEEAKMIREFGCDKIQGFYFGRPMEPEDAMALVERATQARPAARVA